MGEVIYGVPFGKVVRVDFTKNTSASVAEYLEKLSDSGLCEDDLFDIRDSIQDVEAFKKADEVVQTFVTEFFSQSDQI